MTNEEAKEVLECEREFTCENCDQVWCEMMCDFTNCKTMQAYDMAISALEMLSPVRGFTDDLLDRGYAKGRLEALDEIEERVRAWNYSSSKRIPYVAIQEITKSMRGVKTNEEDRGRS